MDVDWEKEINKIRGPFPEVGSSPPEEEMNVKGKLDLETIGDFSKLATVIYFFVDKETGKTYTMQKHWLVDYDELSLREALLLIKKQT